MRYQRLTVRGVRLRPSAAVLLVDDPFGRLGLQVGVAPASWRPRADVVETGDGIRLVLELAGVNEDEVRVEVYDDAVVVTGDRVLPAPDRPLRYHLAEIRQGPFRIEVLLPAAVDADAVSGTYDRGLLTLELPKAATKEGAMAARGPAR